MTYAVTRTHLYGRNSVQTDPKNLKKFVFFFPLSRRSEDTQEIA